MENNMEISSTTLQSGTGNKIRFTCVSCNVQFSTADQQRTHHQTDWHRYNLKRKVCQLPSITADEFKDRLESAQKSAEKAKEIEKMGRSVDGYRCEVCAKSFGSEKTKQTHTESKKHKLAVLQAEKEKENENVEIEEIEVVEEWEDEAGEILFKLKEDAKNAKLYQKKLKEASTEAEIMEILQEKVKNAIKLDPKKNCLFCPFEASDESLETVVEHMTVAHSFFIPDVEYLVDLEGLLRYLGEKISVKNMCIYCNGKGRALNCLDAVWKHMAVKGHEKIAFETEADELEVADFYDFSSTWTDATEDNADQVIEYRAFNQIQTTQDESQLILPSGARVGHRSLQRYYKQHIRVRDEKESVILARLADKYHEMMVSEEPRWKENTEIYAVRRRQKELARKDMQIGMGFNNQKHFRAQIDF